MLHKIFNMTQSGRSDKKRNELFNYLGLGEYQNKYKDTHIYQYSPLDEYFIIGLIDGDGSFYVTFQSNKLINFGFQITQSRSDVELLLRVKAYFNCGEIAYEKGTNIAKYRVLGIHDLHTYIIPFADKYPLYTLKKFQYMAFKKALEIYMKNPILSDENRKLIIDLVYNIYMNGEKRKMTKEEYLATYFPNHS